jgi:hypothetical protein
MSNPVIDETGNRYGRLVVICRYGLANPVRWACQCDCGNGAAVLGAALRGGKSPSCGCLRRELHNRRMAALKERLADEKGRRSRRKEAERKKHERLQAAFLRHPHARAIKLMLGSGISLKNIALERGLDVDHVEKIIKRFGLRRRPDKRVVVQYAPLLPIKLSMREQRLTWSAIGQELDVRASTVKSLASRFNQRSPERAQSLDRIHQEPRRELHVSRTDH